jgi:hypothetical protein
MKLATTLILFVVIKKQIQDMLHNDKIADCFIKCRTHQ